MGKIRAFFEYLCLCWLGLFMALIIIGIIINLIEVMK